MRLLISTLPKSGTHLLTEICRFSGLQRQVGGLPEDVAENHYAADHFAHDPAWVELLRRKGVSLVNLVRDPRDALVSLAHHALASPTPRHAALLAGETDPRKAQRLLLPLAERRWAQADEWVGDGAVLTLRYEDIVGLQGGGSREAQAAAEAALADWIGEATITVEAMDRAYGAAGSSTFRKGRIGQWPTDLDTAVAAEISENQADLLDRWGYRPGSA